MVGLPKSLQDQMESGENPEYPPLDEGHYLCRISEATEVPAKSDKSFPYIKTTWVVLQPEDSEGEKLFLNVSLSPKAAWKVKEVYDALGYSYDSEFEEMIEEDEEAVLYVTKEIIAQGKRAGQIGNNVERVLEPTEENLGLVRASS